MSLKKRICRLWMMMLAVMMLCGMFSAGVQAAGKVSISEAKISVTKGKTHQLKLKNAKKKITWKSSNKAIATVNASGKVTGKKAGSCTITATCQKKSYKCRVRVYNTKIEWMPNALKQKYAAKANKGKIVLAGSSFIEYWNPSSSVFGPYETINVGIGGSRIGDWNKLYTSLIVKYKPKAVVLYIGGNDISATTNRFTGKKAGTQITKLLQKMHKAMPDVPIYYVSLTPSPRRFARWNQSKISNNIVKNYCSKTNNVNYIDCTGFLLKNGKPIKSLYRDKLHFNTKGYQIWNKIIGTRLRTDLS